MLIPDVWHHERLDGSGDPNGLRGDEILVEARTVAVADVWDALTSNRVFRKAWNHVAARRVLEDEAGTTLEPQVVAALIAVLDQPSARRRAPYPAFDQPAISPITV